MMMTNGATGTKVEVVARKRWGHIESTEMSLKLSVPGLKAEDRVTSIRFTFERADEITEADAIDAQCRAGYDDHGYGFWGFIAEQGADGKWTENWACQRSSE